jgi:hypothetical protein
VWFVVKLFKKCNQPSTTRPRSEVAPSSYSPVRVVRVVRG